MKLRGGVIIKSTAEKGKGLKLCLFSGWQLPLGRFTTFLRGVSFCQPFYSLFHPKKYRESQHAKARPIVVSYHSTWHGTPLGCFTPIEVRLGWFSTKLSMWYYVIPSDSLAWEHPEMNSALVKTNLWGELTPSFIWIYLSLGEDGSAVEGRSVCWNREKSRLRSRGVIAATRTQMNTGHGDNHDYLYGCQPKNNGKTPQIIHLFIGFSMIFTIHFGGFPPIFGNTH